MSQSSRRSSRRQRCIQRITHQLNQLVTELNALVLEEHTDTDLSTDATLEPVVIVTPVIANTVRQPRDISSPACTRNRSQGSSSPEVFLTPRSSEHTRPRFNREPRANTHQRTRAVSNRGSQNQLRTHTVNSRSPPPSLQAGDFVEFTNNYRRLRGAYGHIVSVGTAFVSVRLIGEHSHLGIVDRGVRNVRRVEHSTQQYGSRQQH